MSCTVEKQGNFFILTLKGENEYNLLNPTLLYSILTSLSKIKFQATSSSILISKFFCNGFDLPWALTAGSLPEARDRLNDMILIFKRVVAELISFPIPTIAALTGNAAAAGFALALCHDYRIMRRDKGVIYMRELDLGLTLPDYFSALFESKIGSGSVTRDLLLKGKRVRGEEGVEMGILESVHDGENGVMEAALKFGGELADRNWDMEVYAEMRKSLFPQISGLLDLPRKVISISKL